MSPPKSKPLRLLIINPNTSTSMTNALQAMLEDNPLSSSISYTFFTCPEPGIPSINSPSDADQSATLCMPHLLTHLQPHDAFLVACYSQHPLVHMLRYHIKIFQKGRPPNQERPQKHVTGIFEASVTTSLALLDYESDESVGIVSTGKVWEEALGTAVHELFGTKSSDRFVGVETTGLSAIELHDLPPKEVRRKMIDATKRLVRRKKKVRAICLGCAGMAGLDEAVRAGCIDVLGREDGEQVRIVDGVKAGVGVLVGLSGGGF